MCKAFSCLITKEGKVVWQAGKDSHDELLSLAKIKDDTTDGDLIKFAKIENSISVKCLVPREQ